MTERPHHLPPDEPLLSLAARINASLPTGVAISFYRTEYPDGSADTGIVFQCGDRRATMRTRNMLGEGDAEDLARSITHWVGRVQSQSRWSLDPRDAA